MDTNAPRSPICTLEDVRALEHTPLEDRGLAKNVYEGIRRAAAKQPDRVATMGLNTGTAAETPRSLTFAENFAQLNRTANLYHAMGVGPRDAVTLMMPIVPETGVTLWAASTAGIANPVNTFLELDYLEAIMRAAGTKVIVACDSSIDPVSWPKVQALRERLPHVQVVRVDPLAKATPEADVIDYAEATASQPHDRLAFERDIQPDDISAYFHTGGTTGLPKLAQHTHRGHVLQSWCLDQFDVPHPEARVSMLGIPLFHVGGALAGSLHSLLTGQSLVYLHPNGFREPAVVGHYLRNAERFGVNVLGGVPAVWSAFLSLPTEDLDLSRVTHGIVGGATLSAEVANGIQGKLGIPLIEGWGMTEVHCFGTFNPLHGEHRVGSVGIRNPYLEVATVVIDTAGNLERHCAVDEAGLVIIRGPQVTPGYVDPAHNDGAWVSDGSAQPWLNTGDLGRLDTEGYLWLTGRAKDLIIRGGHNIDPALIEDALYGHPDIELAAAVGQPDARVGEMPVAFVQMKAGTGFDEPSLREFVAERIQERAAQPVSIVAMDTLPLTPVGKIFKPFLRDRAAERVLTATLRDVCGPNELVSLEVAPDPRYGSLVTVRLSAAGDPDALRARCESVLASYPFRFEFAD